VSLIRRIASTEARLAPAIARVVLGGVMWPHGAQKMMGIFGGEGFSATVSGMHAHLFIPQWLVVVAILTEFFAPIALVLGLLSRVAALGIGIVMVVAMATLHVYNGFFMNWTGLKSGEGFEYHLLALGLAAVVFLQGGGFLSIDRAISREREWSP
jgi:putative oxidoreductase